MKFLALAVLVSVATGVLTPVHKRKHRQLNLPHTVTFHGLNMDLLDQYKPAGLAQLDMSEITRLEEGEKKELAVEEEILKKVESEYMGSDLHKEALTMKYIPDE